MKLSPQNRISKCRPVLDSLHPLAHHFWTDDPNGMKPHPLYTRHPKVSNESTIIEFGVVTRELWLFEVGVVAGVNAFNAKRVRCVNACDYGSCCLCLLIKHILPPLARPKNVGIVDSCIAFDATLISHQQHQGTHLFGLDSSEYSMQHTHLLFFTPFQFFSMSFHCVRPLLYKGHSLELLINQWIRFWVYEKCELENSPH